MLHNEWMGGVPMVVTWTRRSASVQADGDFYKWADIRFANPPVQGMGMIWACWHIARDEAMPHPYGRMGGFWSDGGMIWAGCGDARDARDEAMPHPYGRIGIFFRDDIRFANRPVQGTRIFVLYVTYR